MDQASVKSKRRSKALRIVGAVAATAIVLVALAGVAVYRTVNTSKGRAFLARRIEALYDSQMQGSMRIGTLERLDGFAADVRDVRFRDPRGHDVIRVRRAHVRAEPLALLHGRLVLRDASAQGATVRLARGREHKTSIQDAFAKAPGKPKRRMEVDTGGIRVRSAQMIVAMGGPTIAVRGLHGTVRVTRFEKDPANVWIRHMAGRVTFPDIDVLRDRSFRMRGVVHAKRTPRVVAHVRGCFPRGEFPMYVRMSPGSVHLRFDPSDDHIMGVIVRNVGRFSDAVETERGDVDMRGLAPCET